MRNQARDLKGVMTVRRRPFRLLMTGAAAALVLPLGGWTAASAFSQGNEGSAPDGAGARSQHTQPASGKKPAELRSIELKPQGASHDRVVFHFADPLRNDRLPKYEVKYLDGYPKKPGSGKPVEMAGQQFLGVNFRHAKTDGDVRERVDKDSSTVAEVRYLGGFEQVQEAAIGVNSCHGAPSKPEYDVKVLDTDIVVDVRAAECGGQGQGKAPSVPESSAPGQTEPSQGPGSPSESADTRECGDVAFEEQSDSGAFGITATGVDCGKAREVAAFAEGERGESYGTPSGFSCQATRDESGQLPTTNYDCTRGGATVEFSVS